MSKVVYLGKTRDKETAKELILYLRNIIGKDDISVIKKKGLFEVLWLRQCKDLNLWLMVVNRANGWWDALHMIELRANCRDERIDGGKCRRMRMVYDKRRYVGAEIDA